MPSILEDDEPRSPNYALRLTEGLDDDDARPRIGPKPGATADTGFAESLTRALEAINAAQNGQATQVAEPKKPETSSAGFLSTLDKLPPIRLPIGPAIPWKIGLPLLAALVVLMGLASRWSVQSDPGVQLPAQQTYPAQQSPLFTQPTQPADPNAAQATQAVDPNAAQPTSPDATTVPTLSLPYTSPTPAPIGVSDPSAVGGIDVMDLGIKLVAVLALAYGSLMLLKKIGIGGASRGKNDGTLYGVSVVSSLALAPNRSVHVIRVPGGRTLLVGATPSSVNLIADLGDQTSEEGQMPEASSFIDALKGKIGN